MSKQNNGLEESDLPELTEANQKQYNGKVCKRNTKGGS